MIIITVVASFSQLLLKLSFCQHEHLCITATEVRNNATTPDSLWPMPLFNSMS